MIKQESESSKLLSYQNYMEAVGSLIYLSTCMQPVISYAVSIVARKMDYPTAQDWVKVKRIYRYIKGTMNYMIQYKNMQRKMIKLEGYADAEWAGNIDDKNLPLGISL